MRDKGADETRNTFPTPCGHRDFIITFSSAVGFEDKISGQAKADPNNDLDAVQPPAKSHESRQPKPGEERGHDAASTSMQPRELKRLKVGRPGDAIKR